jgi:hypothetical protein
MTERVFYEYPEITAEEFERRVKLAIDELEGPLLEDLRSHIRWFKRRYPTPLDRLRYMRRKNDDWAKTRGILTNPR